MTGWKIDIYNESEAKEQKMLFNKKREMLIKYLSNFPDSTMEVTEKVTNQGINSLEELVALSEQELISISGVNKKGARNIIKNASEIVKKQNAGGDEA